MGVLCTSLVVKMTALDAVRVLESSKGTGRSLVGRDAVAFKLYVVAASRRAALPLSGAACHE
jgi:hypothetical protein